MPFLTLLGAAALPPAAETLASVLSSVLPTVGFALYRRYRKRR